MADLGMFEFPAMTMLLLAARRRTHYVFTNTRLQNLIKYTVETGLITTCAVLVSLTLFLTLPESKYYYTVYVLLHSSPRLPHGHHTSQILLSRKAVREYPNGNA